MEAVRTPGIAVNHVAVGFAHTWAWQACVLGLKGQPFVWIVTPKSKKFLKSKGSTCQYNFHSILRHCVTCVTACSVMFHTRSPVCFPLFSIVHVMVPPFVCSLADTECAEVQIHEIAFLHIRSLLHSLFSGVFMTVVLKKCFIYHQDSFKRRTGNKIHVLYLLYLYIFYIFVTAHLLLTSI